MLGVDSPILKSAARRTMASPVRRVTNPEHRAESPAHAIEAASYNPEAVSPNVGQAFQMRHDLRHKRLSHGTYILSL